MNANQKAMKSALAMTIQRCHNPECRDYKYYGGRGITVHPRWRESFEAFLEDMGERPEGMTLERKDNDGPYEPGNCVWASRAQQTKNRRATLRVEYQGQTKTVQEWSEIISIPYSTLKARLRRLGYTVEEAFTKPVRCGGLLPGKQYKVRRRPDMSNVPRGLDHPRTAFNAEQIAQLRAGHLQGRSFSEMAREHGVTTSTVSNAVQGLGPYKGTL